MAFVTPISLSPRLRNNLMTSTSNPRNRTRSAQLVPRATLLPEKISPTYSTSSTSQTVYHLFRRQKNVSPATARSAFAVFGPDITVVEEVCYNIGILGTLSDRDLKVLRWLLSETFDQPGLQEDSFLTDDHIVEVGPRLNFQTAWSSNAVAICQACGVAVVNRLERSRRYLLKPLNGSSTLDFAAVNRFTEEVHDRMTETVYDTRLESFDAGLRMQKSYSVNVLERHEEALREINATLGLGFDDWDVAYYDKLFTGMNRNPTNVELFDLAQSNSEHSRHWFFKGKLVIDGEPVEKPLFDIVRDTLEANPNNSVVAFADNSSTIRGNTIPALTPKNPGKPSALDVIDKDRDILFTAETHNFPSGVAPFPGAETGSGGRIRDTAATGTGSLIVAGTAGYSVGNLHIQNRELPWEDPSFQYPDNLASPLKILISASDGASDYGNKFGEPVINGFARSYGMRLENDERREYVKPIMFSGGMGQMDHSHATKGEAGLEMLVVKVGGPAYRIGMGGGAASSMMQGENKSDLDFNAVQRGDAEMAQKVYRVLRACVEMGDANPIVSIHDQGAGGNCNVVKELIYPSGAKINVRNIWVADESLSALEIWGAEYQEQFGLLLKPEHEGLFTELCERENVTPAVLGSIDGSGRIVLWDDVEQRAVVDMDLNAVLGELPQKTFIDNRSSYSPSKLQIPEGTDLRSALMRVLSLMTVGSKRFLTTKVDRSVSGLVAQQQCVGPLQLPMADFAMIAQSHFTEKGSATAIGERPTLTSLSPQAMARMSVGEMLTNLAGAKITARSDIKCEGNWMWAAKLPGDCASLHDAAVAMRDMMIELEIAIDGGKDSLSMAARCPVGKDAVETVRAPGTLVITGYSTVDDINMKLNPDIKKPGQSCLLHVDIAERRRRMGGSSLGQTFNQTGSAAPDVDDVSKLRIAFDTVQSLIGDPDVLSYHDISDGGLLTAALEMGFAGNSGLAIDIPATATEGGVYGALFAEELGMLLEVRTEAVDRITSIFTDVGLPASTLATTKADYSVTVSVDGQTLLTDDIRDLRDEWESTSFALEKQQAELSCVESEQAGLRNRKGPQYYVPWTPRRTRAEILAAVSKPKVAVVREEGSNGDREMSAAFYMAGFDVWDISVRDIASGRIGLSSFAGIAYVGGFSYADVLDSAKGWAGVMLYNETVKAEFEAFYNRQDTFSLGVCNGCQLMALLGRVPFSDGMKTESQPRFIHNDSGRYESRFSSVRIEESTSIMLRGMAGGLLGVWVAHGEGKAYFPDESLLEEVERNRLVPLRYVDDDGTTSTTYPSNPNGSRNGIAGLCSEDGRHLALMPHPERTVLPWQWGYLPDDIAEMKASPWLRMFQNAYAWVSRKE